MEGPYRDLGSGFARLTGAEGARRGPSPLACVEDALLELLRNARDAHANNIYVATTLKNRRYRTLTVIDDGQGLRETHKASIFEPGVTSRHLHPVLTPGEAPHGAGLSLYHIRNAALSAEVLSTSSPTSIKVVFDTRTLPERTLQSATRPSQTNLLATLKHFAAHNPNLYYASPAPILATLLKNHIIQRPATTGELWRAASGLGLEVSLRTVQRLWRGEIAPVSPVAGEVGGGQGGERQSERASREAPVLALGEEERGSITDILRRAARASYLEVGELELRSRPGEVSVRARIYEPEEAYE